MFDWIKELVNGVGDSISSAIESTWQTISDGIWGKFVGWIYSAVYGALADFFTMMTDIGASLFDLQWVQMALKFFSYFGWGLFVTGMIVAIFDIAVEYQTMGRLNIKRQVLPFLWGLLSGRMQFLSGTDYPVEVCSGKQASDSAAETDSSVL